MSAWRGAAVVAPALVLACGTSGGSPAAGDASTDAGATDAVPDVSVDAEQDPSIYPAMHHPLPVAKNHGGAVVFDPKMATVTFTNDAWLPDIATFAEALPGGAWWQTVSQPFNVSPGASLGEFEVDETGLTGHTLDDGSEFQPWIQKQLSAGKLPVPAKGTLYVFYLPADVVVRDRNGLVTCTDIGGYHDNVSLQMATGGTVAVPYAVVARCSTNLDDLTFAASHEIFEAVASADPAHTPGFYIYDYLSWTGPGGAEVADACAGRGPITLGGTAYARIWSNSAAAAGQDPCQPAPAGRLYFQAAVDTETATVTDSSGTYSSDGFVVMKRGTSRTVEARVYSEAALASDVSLLVGKPTGSTDPTMLGPIATGVTATLSRTTAHNGNAVVVTLSVDASAKTGDYLFDLRSIESPSDFHSWPVVLRVQ